MRDPIKPKFARYRNRPPTHPPEVAEHLAVVVRWVIENPNRTTAEIEAALGPDVRLTRRAFLVAVQEGSVVRVAKTTPARWRIAGVSW